MFILYFKVLKILVCHKHVLACVFYHGCISRRRPQVDFRCLLPSLSTLCFQSLSLSELGTLHLAILAGQLAPGILLSLPLSIQVMDTYHCIPLLGGYWRLKFRASGLHRNHFTLWVTTPALNIFFIWGMSAIHLGWWEIKGFHPSKVGPTVVL